MKAFPSCHGYKQTSGKRFSQCVVLSCSFQIQLSSEFSGALRGVSEASVSTETNSESVL